MKAILFIFTSIFLIISSLGIIISQNNKSISKRKVALVVTWQNEAGYWKGYGPTQQTIVGTKTEDEPIGLVCGKSKSELKFIIHIDKYNIYALHRRLESYDLDAREFLAKQGIQFDSNYLIDRIENEISTNENKGQTSDAQNNYSQSNTTNQIQQQQLQAERIRQAQFNEQRQQKLREIQQQQQRDEEARQQRYAQQIQQQQAADYELRQKNAQIQAQLESINKSRQELNKTIENGLNDISNTIVQLYANKLQKEANQREQEKLNRLQEEAEKLQREQQEIEEQNRRNEKARYEREKLEMERNNRIKNRNYIFNTYTEAYVPLSNTSINSNKLFYFAYSYDRNKIAEQDLTVNVTKPFEVDRRNDGTWPFKNDILKELSPINLSQIIFHGYYYSLEEAINMQENFVNYMAKTGANIKSFTYKGKKSISNNSTSDFWGESTAKSSSSNSADKPKQEAKQEADFWGAPVKK